MSYFPGDIPFMSKEELRENGIKIPKDATDTNVGDTDARQDFMDIVYSELASDPDNNRANRIIWAADGYAESAQLGTNLAEVGTDMISRHFETIFGKKSCLNGVRTVEQRWKGERNDPLQ